MAKKHGPNKENLEATRKMFLQIAKEEFSTQGYYAASTASIVERSGMARGSLYYHFGDKKGLFKAVYSDLMKDMQAAVIEKNKSVNDAWDKLVQGSMTILDLCTSKEIRRIIVDVHTAITYRERIEILNETLLNEMQKYLRQAKEDGYFKGYDLSSLSIIIFGIISEGSRSFELASDVMKARENVGNAFQLFMEKLRA